MFRVRFSEVRKKVHQKREKEKELDSYDTNLPLFSFLFAGGRTSRRLRSYDRRD